MATESLPVLTAAEFASDQDVRWCPGCGDYSILAQLREITAPEDLDGIYTPPGEKTVQTPEKWNMNKELLFYQSHLY